MNSHENLEEYWEEQFDKGVESYYKAIKGDKNAGIEAHRLFEELTKEEPNNTELMAYFGSAKALLARDTFDLREKGKYANEGLKLLDVAVLKDPSNVLIRTLRGNVATNLPEGRFHRTETAIEDFERIINMYERNSYGIPQTLYIETMESLITAYERLGKIEEATEVVNKLLDIDSSYKIPKFNSKIKSIPVANINDPINDEIHSLYTMAICSDEVSLLKVMKKVSQLMDKDSSNPILQAYNVHLNSIKDSHSFAGMVELFTNAYKTLNLLDKLVSEYPTLYKIRYVRAMQSYRLPEFFFFRSSTAARDFQYLSAQYEKNPTIFSLAIYEDILLRFGECFVRLDMVEEAVKQWHKLVEFSSNKEIVTKANELINVFSFEELLLDEIIEKPKEQLYETALQLHDIGVNGNEKAAKQSLALWEFIQKEYSSCPVAKFYYSASLTLLGRFFSDPYEVFSQSIKGLKKLNTSIPINDPRYIQLLLHRAYIQFSLPDTFFRCSDQIIKDFEAVIKMYQSSSDIDITHSQYLKVLADLGTVYEKKYFVHKAKEIWSELAKEDEDLFYSEFLSEKGIRIED
ncbi:tetratricopeptide repeat protein [Metabacillus litoralis]|uniref:tetratricopeptide repeat protein n=1 Tax=Metabacillus litoralis TaxID=152268 RepID=UPI000EF57DA4|nr:hypothetical protein [Metabacillus litoralis]